MKDLTYSKYTPYEGEQRERGKSCMEKWGGRRNSEGNRAEM